MRLHYCISSIQSALPLVTLGMHKNYQIEIHFPLPVKKLCFWKNTAQKFESYERKILEK